MANDYNAFPGLCVTPAGDLLVGWSKRETHTAGVNPVVTRRSSDGVTWEAEQTALSAALTDYGSCALTTLSDGRIALTSWSRASTGGEPNTPVVVFSSDDGATWGSPVDPDVGAYTWACEANLCELPSGRLLWPVWGKTASGGVTYESRLLYSDDDGATWDTLATVAQAGGEWWNEWGLVRLASGRLLAVLRQETGAAKGLYASTSDDDGATWSARTFLLPGYIGAPKLHLGPDGRAWWVARPPTEGGKLRLCVTDGTDVDVSPWWPPSTGRMLYGQVVDWQGDLAVAWSDEISEGGGLAEVFVATLNANM